MNLSKPASLFDISGKVALIVGASGAFGGVAAQTLSNAGAKVVLSAGNTDALNEIASKCDVVKTINARPENEAVCEAMIESTLSAFGRLDILVVASGMNRVDKIEDMDPETFSAVIDANVTQSWLCLLYTSPSPRDRQKSRMPSSA